LEESEDTKKSFRSYLTFIGNQNQGPILVSVSEPKLFLPKLFFCFQMFFSCFPPSWGGYKFSKLRIEHRSSKII
jgi:hypothetical protein